MKLLLKVLKFVVVATLAVLSKAQEGNNENWKPRIDDTSKSELFEIVKEIQVLGPTSFPEPTRLFNSSKVEVIVKPAFGEHRPEQDVVMVSEQGAFSNKVAVGRRTRRINSQLTNVRLYLRLMRKDTALPII
jgi:hypothetical protein